MNTKNYVAENEKNQQFILRLNVLMELKLTSAGRLFQTLPTLLHNKVQRIPALCGLKTLYRVCRIEEADALAERIGTDITEQNSRKLRHINPRTSGRQSGSSLGEVKVIMLLLTESLLAL